MLDTRSTDQNPKKLTRNFKSQKNCYGSFCEEFQKLGKNKQNQPRKTKRGLQFREKPWLMIPNGIGWYPKWTSFTNWRGDPQEQDEHKRENKRNTQEQAQITHPLDSHPHKIHKGTRTTKGKIQGGVHLKSKGGEVLMIQIDPFHKDVLNPQGSSPKEVLNSNGVSLSQEEESHKGRYMS